MHKHQDPLTHLKCENPTSRKPYKPTPILVFSAQKRSWLQQMPNSRLQRCYRMTGPWVTHLLRDLRSSSSSSSKKRRNRDRKTGLHQCYQSKKGLLCSENTEEKPCLHAAWYIQQTFIVVLSCPVHHRCKADTRIQHNLHFWSIPLGNQSVPACMEAAELGTLFEVG